VGVCFKLCYALFGIGFIGFVISDVFKIMGYVIKELERKARKASVKTASEAIARHAQATTEKAPFTKRHSLQDFIEDLLTESEEEEAQRGALSWYIKGIAVNTVRIICCWVLGAVILVAAEDFRFGGAFYCAAISSLSVGYGDFSPYDHQFTHFINFISDLLCYLRAAKHALAGCFMRSTSLLGETGVCVSELVHSRSAPLRSVTWALACIGSLTMRLSQLQITKKKFTEPLSSLMSMDVDGSGSISKSPRGYDTAMHIRTDTDNGYSHNNAV
jgi:hypothetical protein